MYDGFWTGRDYLRRADRIEASVLLECSWADYKVHPVNSSQIWDRVADRVPSLLRMGQQGHGTTDFANSARLRHAWFDRWLLGRDTGVMAKPKIQSRAQDGTVHTSAQWPPASTTTEQLRLGEAGTDRNLVLGADDSPGWIDLDPLQSESQVLEGRAPLTLQVGEPTTATQRIAGVPVLDVRVRSDTESTQLTPVLFDEAPDSTRSFVSKGLFNSRNRDGLGVSTPLPENRAWTGANRFQPTDHVLAKGHRLGLAMMSIDTDEAMYAYETRATYRLLLGGTVLRLPVG